MSYRLRKAPQGQQTDPGFGCYQTVEAVIAVDVLDVAGRPKTIGTAGLAVRCS